MSYYRPVYIYLSRLLRELNTPCKKSRRRFLNLNRKWYRSYEAVGSSGLLVKSSASCQDFSRRWPTPSFVTLGATFDINPYCLLHISETIETLGKGWEMMNIAHVSSHHASM